MSARVWFDGALIPIDNVPFAATDLGIATGLGVFETMRADKGEVFALDLHLSRLKAGLKQLGMPELDDADWTSRINQVLTVNDLLDATARVRLTVHAGQGSREQPFIPESCHITVSASPLVPLVSAAKVMTTDFARNVQSPLMGVKSVSYGECLVVYNQAKAAGFDEVLQPNTRGELCEAATSNVFCLFDGSLCTPPLSSGCLPGVTRQIVLDLAKELNIEVKETVIPYDQLSEVTEAFLTSSLRNIQHISHIDDRELSELSDDSRRLAEALENNFS